MTTTGENKLKPQMARIYSHNDSAELYSVPTKSLKNSKPTTIKSCRFFLLHIVDARSYFVRYVLILIEGTDCKSALSEFKIIVQYFLTKKINYIFEI